MLSNEVFRMLSHKTFAVIWVLILTTFVSCGTGQISTNKGDRQRDKARNLRRGCCCFTGETLVKMANGNQKSIQDLQVGDEILSYNLVEGHAEPAKILGLVSVEHDNLVEYVFRDETVKATEDHPFFLKSKGWASSSPFETTQYYNFRDRNLSFIEPGDIFYYRDAEGKMKESTLLAIKTLEGNFQTYTIVRLEKNECFFANGRLTGVEEITRPVSLTP